MPVTIQLKRGLAAGITAGSDGEPKWTTDTHEVFVSQDGVLYRINWKHQGAWSGATAYIYGDVVEDAGSNYLCILGHTNQTPPNATYWVVVAEKGDPGTDGTDGLGFTLLGAWSGATTYAVNDVVSLSGSSYACILAHTNHTPPNATYWTLLASKGDTGGTGPTGSTGPGVPTGGTALQYLRKIDGTDYNTEWATLAATGNRHAALTADAKSAAFTAVWDKWYTCTSGAYTIDLPTAVGNAGKIIVISCNCSSTVTLALDGSGAETVGGKTTLALVVGDRIELISNGTNVEILSFTHGDWISFSGAITGTTNPTLGGTRTELYSWKRQGQDMLLNLLYVQGSAGSGGTGPWRITLPLSATVDTAVCLVGDWSGTITSTCRNIVGEGTILWDNGTVYTGRFTPFMATSGALGGWITYDGGGTVGTMWNQTTWPFTATRIYVSINARIPISGW
jgi:hypothetical protein